MISDTHEPYLSALSTRVPQCANVKGALYKNLSLPSTLSSFLYGEKLARLNLETVENVRFNADLVSHYKIFISLIVFFVRITFMCVNLYWYKT